MGFLDAIEDTRDRVDEVLDEYDDSSDPEFETFVIGYPYIYWEQYLTSFEDLFTVVGLSLAGIFAATFVLQCSLVTSLLLCLTILVVGIEVLGFLPLLNLEVNAFSSTNVILSLGMSIEFTSHIAHEFLVEQGEERADRIVRALRFMVQSRPSWPCSSLLARKRRSCETFISRCSPSS